MSCLKQLLFACIRNYFSTVTPCAISTMQICNLCIFYVFGLVSIELNGIAHRYIVCINGIFLAKAKSNFLTKFHSNYLTSDAPENQESQSLLMSKDLCCSWRVVVLSCPWIWSLCVPYMFDYWTLAEECGALNGPRLLHLPPCNVADVAETVHHSYYL